MADNSRRPVRRPANADTDDIPNIDRIRQRRNSVQRPQTRGDYHNNPQRNASRSAYNTHGQRPRYADRPNGQRPGNGAARRARKNDGGHSAGYKAACVILIILIVLTLVLTGLGVAYFHLFDYNRVDISRTDDPQVTPEETMFVEDGVEVRTIVPVHEGDERGSLYESIKDWKRQGNSNFYLQSTKVINILLAGIDRNEDGSDGRSDSMMLASVNLNTKQVILSSIYRDCWFWATFDNDERDIWCKINESFVYGGASGLVENLEDYFKLHIDHIVGVDFESFRDIIDGIGGIDVGVTAREADYINEQTGYTANPAVEGEHVHLDGFQALWYVRMRHVDAEEEVGRTRRQRQFVTAMIDKFKGISATELGNLVNTFMSYIQTDMTKAEILTYGTRAVLGQWYNYEIVQQHVPDDDFRTEAYRQGYFDNKWVWVSDFPGAAQAMQMKIYGYTNVVLNEDRRTAVDIWNRE